MLADAVDYLSFEELRSACYRHFTYLPYVDLNNFHDPGLYFLHEEFAKLAQRLEGNRAKFDEVDLTNAFYSTVFQLEHGKLFLPVCLVAPKSIVFRQNPVVARLKRFSQKYPFVFLDFYKQDGSFELRKTSYQQDLTECFLVLNQDPLIGRRGTYGRTA